MDSMFKSMVIFIFFTFLSLLSTSVFANTFYVKSYLLPVYQQKTGGQPFHQFRRGDQLQLLQISREGWVQVKKGEVQGWVQQNRLSTKPVQSRISLTKRSLKPAVRKKRSVRVRTVMAAVGVKGLRDSKSGAFKETESDLKAIRELESLSPDAQESVDFILSSNP